MLISKKKQELGEEDGAEAEGDDEAERAGEDDEAEDGDFFTLVGVLIGVEATRGCRSDAGDDDDKAEQTTKSSII